MLFQRRNNGDCFFFTTDTEWRIAKPLDYHNDKPHPSALLLSSMDPNCLIAKGKGKLHLPSEYTQDMRARSSQSDNKRPPPTIVHTYMLLLVRVLLRACVPFLVYGSCLIPLMLPVACAV